MRGTTPILGVTLPAALSASTVLAAVLAGPVALAGPATADRFADHPAALYQGPIVLPDFDGAQADWRDYRTPIKEGVKEGVSFAGGWAVVGTSCGLHCTVSFAVNLADGSITDLPVSGEEFLDVALYVEPTSALLKATWVTDFPPSGRCMIGEYLLEGHAFRELSVVEHPVYEDCQ